MKRKTIHRSGDGRGRADGRRSCARTDDQSRLEHGNARLRQQPNRFATGPNAGAGRRDPVATGHPADRIKIDSDEPQRGSAHSWYDRNDHAGNEHAGSDDRNDDARNEHAGSYLRDDAVGNTRSRRPGAGAGRPAGAPEQGHGSSVSGHGTQDAAGGARLPEGPESAPDGPNRRADSPEARGLLDVGKLGADASPDRRRHERRPGDEPGLRVSNLDLTPSGTASAPPCWTITAVSSVGSTGLAMYVLKPAMRARTRIWAPA